MLDVPTGLSEQHFKRDGRSSAARQARHPTAPHPHSFHELDNESHCRETQTPPAVRRTIRPGS